MTQRQRTSVRKGKGKVEQEVLFLTTQMLLENPPWIKLSNMVYSRATRDTNTVWCTNPHPYSTYKNKSQLTTKEALTKSEEQTCNPNLFFYQTVMPLIYRSTKSI